MKILLINPSSRHAVSSLVPDAITSGIGNYPPLGLLYIGSNLKKQVDCELKILDVSLLNLEFDQINEEVASFNPDLVGISARTYQYYDSINIARLAKEACPQAHICIGGPHVNVFPEETLNNWFVDSVIQGEAEYIIPELVRRLSGKQSLAGMPGVFYKSGGSIFSGGPPQPILDINALPFPDRTLIDYKKYYRLLSNKEYSTTLISSRGCPNRCIFCDVQHKKWRARAADNVLDELELCYSLGITDCYFVDDTFNLDRQRVINICKGILKRKLKIVWSFRGRVEKVDDELLELAKASGCDNIQYGVESGSQNVLKMMKKNIRLEEVEKAFALSRKHKINSVAYFMMGLPGETKEDILATINFALKIKPDIAHFTIAMPYPHTELYNIGLEKGLFNEFWRDFTRNPVPHFVTPYCVTEMTPEEVVELYRLATKKFYLRPQYLIKELFSVRSVNEFKRKTKTGVRLLLDVIFKKSH